MSRTYQYLKSAQCPEDILKCCQAEEGISKPNKTSFYLNAYWRDHVCWLTWKHLEMLPEELTVKRCVGLPAQAVTWLHNKWWISDGWMGYHTWWLTFIKLLFCYCICSNCLGNANIANHNWFPLSVLKITVELYTVLYYSWVLVMLQDRSLLFSHK